jgi:hypothetical protein
MKVFRIVMRIVSIALLASTLICGLYLKGQPVLEPSSIQFHMTIAIAGIFLGIATMFLPGKKTKA